MKNNKENRNNSFKSYILNLKLFFVCVKIIS